VVDRSDGFDARGGPDILVRAESDGSVKIALHVDTGLIVGCYYAKLSTSEWPKSCGKDICVTCLGSPAHRHSQ
jgi:hypothetical protein